MACGAVLARPPHPLKTPPAALITYLNRVRLGEQARHILTAAVCRSCPHSYPGCTENPPLVACHGQMFRCIPYPPLTLEWRTTECSSLLMSL